LETIMKAIVSAALVAFTSFAALAHATFPADTTIASGKPHVNGPRDPYTDGAKASKFDVYSEGAKVTDQRDPYTDGGHI
jgi:hypothetical protein